MTLKTQLNNSMKDAMKSGDEVRKRTVRMALAAVKQVEVDKRVELDDVAIVGLLQKEVKNRRESLEEAKKANRSDLIEANQAEIKVLEVFLPKAMPTEELRALAQAAITETGASSPADMGKVMKIVMAKVAAARPMTWSARPCGNCSKNKMGNPNARNRPFPGRIRTLQFILLVLVSIISYGALVIPQAISPAASPLQAGEVSPSDFQAPETGSFISEVRTEEARRAAENGVPPVYA